MFVFCQDCASTSKRKRKKVKDTSTDTNTDNLSTTTDHSYSCTNKNPGQSSSFKVAPVKIASTTKDLQKQNEEVQKRYHAKIEESNDVYTCRSCSSVFSSYLFALLHAKQPKCVTKKKKVKKDLKTCDEPDCERKFLYKKELVAHKLECHPKKFKCPDCEVFFKT